jgi:hypothetical protein
MAKAGRPRKKFDLKQIEAFGRLGLTGIEMASLLGTTNVTISHRMTDEKSEFFKAYQLGFSDLKKSIRRKQIAVALKGNTGLLIWLGKQLLDQHEQPTTAVSVIQNASTYRTPSMSEFRQRSVDADQFARKHNFGLDDEPPANRLENNGA